MKRKNKLIESNLGFQTNLTRNVDEALHSVLGIVNVLLVGLVDLAAAAVGIGSHFTTSRSCMNH